MNFRAIGKFGFLLVVIGFCMPMACDANGFQIANSDMASTELSLALYALFFTAIIGVIIGVLLLSGKDVPIFLEWIILLICMGCFFIPFFTNKNDFDYQSGVYVVMIGLIISFISQFFPNEISSYSNSSSRRYSSNKKCRQCGTIYSGSQSSCPKCNFSLYEETNQNIDGTISPVAPINANYGDTWTCKKCGEKNRTTTSSCKGCGAYK